MSEATGEKKTTDWAEYVGVAIAHFKLSPRDAWGMSLVEFWSAFYSLFPPKEDEQSGGVRREGDKIITSGFDGVVAALKAGENQ